MAVEGAGQAITSSSSYKSITHVRSVFIPGFQLYGHILIGRLIIYTGFPALMGYSYLVADILISIFSSVG